MQRPAQGLADGDDQQHGAQHHAHRQRIDRPQERTREVKLLDPASFTIILESNEVHGEGFRMLRVAEPHAGDEK